MKGSIAPDDPTSARVRSSTGLSRARAIPLALGSVAGSGILFLPSAVYAASGPNVLVVWAVATLLCVPMLLMFGDVVGSHPDGDGIESFVRLGLGPLVGQTVPILFAAVVVVGLPAGAMVAGRYVADAMGAGASVAVASAVGLLGIATATCLSGTTASARLQLVGTAALLTTAAVLVAIAFPGTGQTIDAVTPNASVTAVIFPGVLLAFWAFVGFENLTFLSREFRSPALDFFPVSAAALGIYAVLTVGLSATIAARVSQSGVDELTGLLQLADVVALRDVVVVAVTLVAFGAMLLNAVAWMWGVSRLVADAASRGILPETLSQTGVDRVPRRAIVTMAGLFSIALAVLVAKPGLIVDAVATASAIFVVLYILSIVSYVRVRGFTVRSTMNVALLLILVPSLIQSGWRSAYALVVLIGALVIGSARGRANSEGRSLRE